MRTKMKYVISVGGSLIVPDEVDTKFVREFTLLIKNRVKAGDRFFITIGGGKVCRQYQAALSKVTKASDYDLDLIGIASTKFNAEFMRLVFGNVARRELITDPTKRVKGEKGVNLITGWEPGRSTDDDAVRIAKNHGVGTVVNLSDIGYIYDKDPRRYKNAKKITNLSWDMYFEVFGKKWKPGAHVPFDQTAAQNARRNRIKVIIMNGRDIANLKNYLSGRKFKGTVIE